MTRRPYTAEEDEVIRMLWGACSCREIGYEIGRDRNSVACRARRLGLEGGYTQGDPRHRDPRFQRRLIELWERDGSRACETLGLTRWQAYRLYKKLTGKVRQVRWSEADLQIVRGYYPDYQEIRRRVSTPRTLASVRNAARTLGLPQQHGNTPGWNGKFNLPGAKK